MATPVGHALAGYAIGRMGLSDALGSSRGMLILCMILAISPDFDFLPGMAWGQPALYHQGLSHSLGFALAVSGLTLLCLQRTIRRPVATWGVLFAAYSSHLLIDLFGPDGRPPLGIPLFWPLVEDHYMAPVTVLLGMQHVDSTSATTAEWIRGIIDWHNVKAILVESAVVAPLVLTGELRQRRVCKRVRAARAAKESR